MRRPRVSEGCSEPVGTVFRLTQWVPTVESVGVGRERRLQDAAQLLGHDHVDVGEGDVLDVEQLAADAVHRVVLVHQDGVRQAVEVSQRQHRVVVLDDHLEAKRRITTFILSFKSHSILYFQKMSSETHSLGEGALCDVTKGTGSTPLPG